MTFKKGYTPWNKGEKQLSIVGEKHPNWKGDNIGYFGVHSWIKRTYGNANKCENPKCEGKSKTYEWSNLDHKYKRNRLDWVMSCRPCHSNYDYEKFGIRKAFYTGLTQRKYESWRNAH